MDTTPQRIDTWLWVARMTKTRSLAHDAVTGGRVQVNGDRCKPSRLVKPGDRLEITLGPARRELVVQGTTPRRGPATDAVLLYEETAESVARTEQAIAERRLGAPKAVDGGGRPTKRDRRRMDRERGR